MELEHWHWWVLSLLFVVFAAVLRSPLFLGMTLASGVVGAVLWINAETAMHIQLGIFLGITVLWLGVASIFEKKAGGDEGDESPAPQTMALSQRLVGSTFTLENPIVQGVGTLDLKGTTFRLRGDDMDAGTKVRITSIDGIDPELIFVEKLENKQL